VVDAELETEGQLSLPTDDSALPFGGPHVPHRSVDVRDVWPNRVSTERTVVINDDYSTRIRALAGHAQATTAFSDHASLKPPPDTGEASSDRLLTG
jgi:hypothetical protein